MENDVKLRELLEKLFGKEIEQWCSSPVLADLEALINVTDDLVKAETFMRLFGPSTNPAYWQVQQQNRTMVCTVLNYSPPQ